MKVEELEMYGKALEMPKEAMKQQTKIVFRLLRKEFGVFGIPGLLLRMIKHSRRITKQYPEALKKCKKYEKITIVNIPTVLLIVSTVECSDQFWCQNGCSLI